jgi:hypothetical protein
MTDVLDQSENFVGDFERIPVLVALGLEPADFRNSGLVKGAHAATSPVNFTTKSMPPSPSLPAYPAVSAMRATA